MFFEIFMESDTLFLSLAADPIKLLHICAVVPLILIALLVTFLVLLIAFPSVICSTLTGKLLTWNLELQKMAWKLFTLTVETVKLRLEVHTLFATHNSLFLSFWPDNLWMTHTFSFNFDTRPPFPPNMRYKRYRSRLPLSLVYPYLNKQISSNDSYLFIQIW